MISPPLYPRSIKPRTGSAVTVSIPAPSGGLNTIDPGYGMPETECPLLYNMIGAENGLRSRLGSKEWCTTLTGLADNTVRTILPFTGSSGGSDRLFACTSTGIWDVSSSSASPSQVVVFANQTGNAGYGVGCVFVNTSGGHFLLYTDEVNGYYTYSEALTTWVKVVQASTTAWTAATGFAQNSYCVNGGLTYKQTTAGTPATAAAPATGPSGTGTGIVDGACTWNYSPAINGVDPANFAFVMVWKNRPWFVEKTTGFAWWLGVGGIYGTASRQNFGSQFKAGGDLRGLFNWTLDGGSGPDDRLVGISGGGDVVVYEGTDPSSVSTFGLVGKWYCGGVPAGRRIATDYGGDLLLLTSIGLLPLSKLVLGNPVFDKSPYLTAKIATLFNRIIGGTRTATGWAVALHPEDNSLIVTLPFQSEYTQIAYSLVTKGWSQYRELHMVSMGAWGGQLYYGTEDGRVMVNTGYVDGVLLSNPSAFTAIRCSGITKFSNLGTGRQKQIQIIRPTIISETGNVFSHFEARYRYDLTEVLSTIAVSGVSGNLWDVALWDVASWGGAYATQQAAGGASGMGPDVAIAWRIDATSRTVLVAMDVALTQGAML